MTDEWKPPAQFDFTSSAPAQAPAPSSSWKAPTSFDFQAPDDFDYRGAMYGDAGVLGSAGSYLKDIFNTYMGGAARTVESIGFLTQNFGSSIPIIRDQVDLSEKITAKIEGRAPRTVDEVFDEGGQAIRDLGKDSSNYWFDKVSDGFTTAMQSGIYDEDFGVTTIVAGAAASLNESMLTMGAGAAAGKLTALAAKVGTQGVAAQAALGSVRAKRIMKYASYVPALSGAVAGGLTEGTMAAGASGVAVEEQIMQMGHEELLKGSSRYFEIWSAAEGMDLAEREKYAKTTLAEEAGKSVAVSVGLSTAALGAPMGALAGHLGGKAVKGTGVAKAATWLESRVAGQAAIGAAGEAGQEFMQEGAQQFLQNLGLREYANSKQSLSQDVFSSAVLGGLIGGVMGGVMTPMAGAESRKNAKAELGSTPAPSSTPSATPSAAADPTPVASRNPILEARIVDLLGRVSEAEVPAGEFMKVARWAGHNQEGVGGGRSSLEFAKALEHLVETGVAPDDVNAAVGEDLTDFGMLTEAAYAKDAKRFAFESELRIKPSKGQVLPVLQALGKNGANPYVMKDGTLVVPQSAGGADGLAAVGSSIESETGAAVKFIRIADENPALAEAETAPLADPAARAAAEEPAKGAEGGVIGPASLKTQRDAGSLEDRGPALPRTERVSQAVAGMPVSVQSNATVVIEPGMDQAAAEAAIDAAGGVLAATHDASAYSEPTDAQKAAGNYPKLPLLFKGNAPGESVRVVIENVPGSKRKSMPGSPKWTRVMRHHYGYIPGTKAADGDPVDIYLGRAAHDAERPIFVIRQLDPKTGAFDEPKVVMGYEGEGEARAAYLSEYPRSMHDKLFGGITRMDRAQFNAWVKSGATDVAPDPITKQPMLSLRRTNETVEARSAEGRTPGDAASAREADARRAGESATGVEGGPGARSGKGAAGQENKAVDASGEPVIVWRGEHGQGSKPGRVHTRMPSISFGSRKAAATYASDPNNNNDTVFRARVFPARLTIRNPVINNDDDPFIEGRQIADAIGEDAARELLIRLDRHVENTNNWAEEIPEKYGYFATVREFLEKHPEGIDELFLNAYPVFDDPAAVELFKAAGYDGAIHLGNGQTGDELEYKVFDESQIEYVTKKPKPKLDRAANFAAWFEGSKVVNEDGTPKVVYHGADVDEGMFDTFNEDDTFWASERGHAEYFVAGDGEVVEAYLSIKNPMIVTDEMLYDRHDTLSEADQEDTLPRMLIHDFIKEAKEAGHDGVIAENFPDLDYSDTVYITFKPSQVKSATENSGAFDPANPSFLASLAPKTPKFAQNKIKPNAVSVLGVHYSSVDGLKKLDPSMAGSGSAGGERRRMGMGTYGKKAKPGDIARRLYFYEQATKKLPAKEGAVSGNVAYRVQLENIYDLAKDPDDIYQVIADTYGPMTIGNIDLIEETINELGYDGFIAEAQPGMHVRPIVVFGLKGQVPVERVGAPAMSLAKAKTTSDFLRNLTPSEQKKVTNAVATKIVARLEQLPHADEYAAAAYAGRAKRGWYAQSAQALNSVFGVDAPRFAALLAAMSPQTSVQSNLRNALNVWANWVEAGRPTEREDIIDIMANSVEGTGGRSSVLNAWINNTERALTHPDPLAVMLSGPKVDSFMRNLLGDVEAVTLDTWMANFAAFEQATLGGSMTKFDPGKRPTYLAMSARIREAAARLTELTGETWTPAEVQETVWSWAKTLAEMSYSANETRSADELIQDGALTDELIASTPDFGNLLANEEFASILIGVGYEEQIEQIRSGLNAAEAARAERGVAGEAAPFDRETQRALEVAAARRLDGLREGREVTDDPDYIPFSLAPKRRASVGQFAFDVRQQIKLPGYAVLTATQEAVGPGDHPQNKQANVDLAAELVERGLEFNMVTGFYKGVDQGSSFVVFTDEATAKELAAKYNQESVLTNRGLVYTDGRIVPADHSKDVIGQDAEKEDFYSVVYDQNHGFRVPFSVGLDFDNIRQDVKSAAKVNSPDNIEDVFIAPGLYSAMYHAIQHEKGVPKLATAKQWSEWLDGAQRRGLFRAEERVWTEIDAMLAKRAAKAEKRPTSRTLRISETSWRTLDSKTQDQIDALIEEFPDAQIVTIDNAKIAIDDVLSTIEESYPEIEEVVLAGMSEDERMEAVNEMVNEMLDGYDSGVMAWSRLTSNHFAVKWTDENGISHRVEEEFDTRDEAEEFVADLTDYEYRVENVQTWEAVIRERGGREEVIGDDYETEAEADEAAMEAEQERSQELYDEARTDYEDQLTDEEIRQYATDYGNAKSSIAQYPDWTAPGGENYREILLRSDSFRYVAPHFDDSDNDAGLLMHGRVKDRFEGNKKIFYIEEIQSDLHQAAREKGGMMTGAERNALADRLGQVEKDLARVETEELRELIPKIPNDFGNMVPSAGTRFIANAFRIARFDPEIVSSSFREEGMYDIASAVEANADEFVRLTKAMVDLKGEKAEIEEKLENQVDPAPFHKSWPEVMLKHLIRQAAIGGYDSIAWTTGKQQAERYRGGVSQVVDELVWSMGFDGDEGFLFGYLDGSEKFRYSFDPKTFMSTSLINGENRSLKDIIGADLAAQVESDPSQRHKMKADLVVGGKGMVVQYDIIMPKTVEKLVKKLGGRVSRDTGVGLPGRTPGGVESWRVDITPEMREALSQPLPAYSLAKEHDNAAGRLYEAKTIVDDVASNLRGAPPYTVVGNDSHLPSHALRMIKSAGVDGQVEGFLDPISGRVFIVADNVSPREGETYRDAVERVFAEEVLGHHGLRAVFGKAAMNSLFDQVYRSFKNDARMRDIVSEYADTYGDPADSKDSARRMADEFLAKSNPNDQPSLWSMLVSWVRENLRKMGFVREWSENDVRNLMERVFDSVRTGIVPSSLQRMSTALVEFDGTDVSRTDVRDGSGVRHVTESNGMRAVSTLKFQADVLDGEFDALPAAEVTAFKGSVKDLARYVGGEGKQRIVASLGVIPERAARASGFAYRIDGQAIVLEVPKVVEKPTGIFSLRNRARGSDEVEAILEKSIAQPTSDMSTGQKLQKMFHELTGYFGSSDTWLELKAGWIDSATAIEKLERDQFSGSLLDASESAYKMINLTRNLPQIVAAVSKVGVPVYRDGSFVRQPGRKGLYEIFAPLWKTTDGLNLQYLWEGYAVARRSSQLINERNPDGTSKEKLLDATEIQKLLDLEKQHPEFKKVFDDWQQFNRELLDLAVDRGTMTAETAALWKQNDYVPFFRVDEEEEVVAGIKRKRGISGQAVTSKRLTGSDRRIQPVLENIVMNTASIIEKVYRNEAMNRVVALADGVAMTKAPAHMEAVKLNNADIARQLVKAGLFVGDDSNNTPEQRRAGRLLRQADIDFAIRAVERMSPEQREAWTTFFRPARPEGNDIVSVMVAGKPVYYRVFDPLVLRGIMDMTPTNFGGLVNLMGGAKRLLTTMVTLDPGFMIANYQRDTLSAWTTVNESFTPMAGAIKDAVSIWTDDALMENIGLAGGMVGGFYNPTQDFGDVMQKVTHSGGTVVNGVRSAVDAYRKIGMVSEQVNRVAIARAVLRRGGSLAEAAYQSQDVMNFSQHGDAVAAQLLIRTVPFLNARIQGLYRLWKGAKGLDGANPNRARLAFFMKFMSIAGISMLLALKNADDERYEQLTDDQKDIYWHIFIGKHHFAIPKPFEVGVLSATIPERAMRRLMGHDKTRDTAHSIERALLDTFAFNPIPQLFKPMVEQWANRTFFGQRPIVGQDIEKLEPVAQYNPWTSETARGVAQVVDQVVPDSMKRYVPGTMRSPTRLEHAMRAYLGTVGSYMLQLSDAALRQGGAFPAAPSMRDVRDVPVLGSVAGRFYRGDSELEGRTKYADDLYAALDEADAAYSTVSAYMNRGELEKAQRLVDAKINPLTVRPVLHEFRTQASDLNTMQRQVLNSEMTPDEKREALDEIARAKNRLMREADPYLGMMDW